MSYASRMMRLTTPCEREANSFLLFNMPTLVIKSVPPKLHARLKRTAIAHRRSLTQETLHLLETALGTEDTDASVDAAITGGKGASYWGRRHLVPAYAAALAAGAFAGGHDSTTAVSAERDMR